MTYRVAGDGWIEVFPMNEVLVYQRDTLVDLVNLASIAYGYSIGGFDADKFEGDKPLHSSPCPTRQRFCTPLSCAGQSYPAKMGGRMTADGFSCITLSVKWLTCFTVGGRKR